MKKKFVLFVFFIGLAGNVADLNALILQRGTPKGSRIPTRGKPKRTSASGETHPPMLPKPVTAPHQQQQELAK